MRKLSRRREFFPGPFLKWWQDSGKIPQFLWGYNYPCQLFASAPVQKPVLGTSELNVINAGARVGKRLPADRLRERFPTSVSRRWRMFLARPYPGGLAQIDGDRTPFAQDFADAEGLVLGRRAGLR
jgi:hypothetical protein